MANYIGMTREVRVKTIAENFNHFSEYSNEQTHTFQPN